MLQERGRERWTEREGNRKRKERIEDNKRKIQKSCKERSRVRIRPFLFILLYTKKNRFLTLLYYDIYPIFMHNVNPTTYTVLASFLLIVGIPDYMFSEEDYLHA